MTAADWLNRSVSRLAGDKKESKVPVAPADPAQNATKKVASTAPLEALPAGRSTRERLTATLRQKEEALSPRVLRRTLEELKAIVDPQVSEVEGGRRAMGVAGWYARAQLVAFPVLRDEPFGLVGPEAMAHGKPIIAFAGGAVDEWLVPGETGLRVESKTVGALAAALRELLQDPARCIALGAAARRRHAGFTLDAYLDRLIPSLERARQMGPKVRA